MSEKKKCVAAKIARSDEINPKLISSGHLYIFYPPKNIQKKHLHALEKQQRRLIFFFALELASDYMAALS